MNPYNFYGKCYGNTSFFYIFHRDFPRTAPCISVESIFTYFNEESVQTALRITREEIWLACNEDIKIEYKKD